RRECSRRGGALYPAGGTTAGAGTGGRSPAGAHSGAGTGAVGAALRLSGEPGTDGRCPSAQSPRNAGLELSASPPGIAAVLCPIVYISRRLEPGGSGSGLPGAG